MKKTTLFILLLALYTSSCIKENFNSKDISKQFDNETSLAVPIGYITTTFQEIFASNYANGQLIEDENGLLWFNIEEDFLNISAQDLYDFPTRNSSFQITNNTGSDIDLTNTDNTVTITETFFIDFGFSQGTNTEEIDSIVLNNLDLDITVLLSSNVNANLTVTFPGVRYNDLVYSKDLIIGSSNRFSDLDEYTINLDNQGVNKNQLEIVFELTINSADALIPVDQLISDVDIQFSNLNFSAIYGYFGQHTISSDMQELLINLNQNTVRGLFNFDHTYLNIISRNSFGVPFNFDINNFTSREYDTQNQLTSENVIITYQSEVIDFPRLNQVGEIINDTTSVDADAITLYFNDYYSTISGSLEAFANPNGNTDYNFALDTSRLIISSQLSAPFWGYTDNMSMQDTVDFNIQAFFENNILNISRYLFILNFTNALPINCYNQVYFCDASGTRLDSMFMTPQLVEGASDADANGKVGANENAPIKAEITGNRIANIANTTQLVIKSYFETIDADETPPVSWKMFSDYYFYFHIGVAVDIESN